ncbi:hypothetical protein JKY72_04315 [Candidatus Gracilibacteria bacterium]|nr:hypothetical protein [Candidatus Gracilibacteria bacterium]
MRKFTIFTVILAVIIFVVASEVAVEKYLPSVSFEDNALEVKLPDSLDLSKIIETNIFGSDLTNRLGDEVSGNEIVDLSELEFDEISLDEVMDAAPDIAFSSGTSELEDFEDENFVARPVGNVFLREEQVQSAGFVEAYIEEEAHDGMIYKSIFIDDLFDTKMTKYVVRTEASLLAKVYVMETGINTEVDNLFEVLKVRASEGLEIEVNDTNDFGASSFYMNDSRRPSTAFLTVRIGPLIYGFSYPKAHHTQIKNLVTLIDWEI